MSSQYDLLSPSDLTALSSATGAQLMQTINRLAPLFNIGGIILQPGASLNATILQNTNGAPDVTNNPRFARYIWLNTYNAAAAAPTPYYYNASTGNWTTNSIAALSIVNADISATAAIVVSKLAFGTARYLVRTNAAGNAVEYVAPASAFIANEIPVNDLVAGGSDGYLKTVTGAVAWVDNATERAAIYAGITSLVQSVLQAGTIGNILYTNPSGVTAWGTPAQVLPTGSLVPLAALTSAGAAANDVLVNTGAVWIRQAQALGAISLIPISVGGWAFPSSVATQVQARIHSLGGIPKLVRAVIVMTNAVADLGYNQNDEVDIAGYRSGPNEPQCAVCADNTNITVLFGTVAGELPNKTTGIYAAIDPTKWFPKVYAWL